MDYENSQASKKRRFDSTPEEDLSKRMKQEPNSGLKQTDRLLKTKNLTCAIRRGTHGTAWPNCVWTFNVSLSECIITIGICS